MSDRSLYTAANVCVVLLLLSFIGGGLAVMECFKKVLSEEGSLGVGMFFSFASTVLLRIVHDVLEHFYRGCSEKGQ